MGCSATCFSNETDPQLHMESFFAEDQACGETVKYFFSSTTLQGRYPASPAFI